MTLVADLEAILDCAVTELEDTGQVVPDDVFVSPGQVAFDNPCGQLWVRVISAFPSDDFPNRFQTLRNCVSGLAVQVGLGIIRCQSGTHRIEKGGYPTPDEQTADALSLVCDQGALFRALACCYPATEGAVDIVVNEWTQFVPQGGVIGGEWTAYLRSSLWCESSP